MTTKFFSVVCLITGLLLSTNAAVAARWTRGQCIDAVNQRLGVRATDAGRTTNRAAVARCLKYGPDAID
jgi:hypothetical protein